MKKSAMLVVGAVLSGLLVLGCDKSDQGPDEAAPAGVSNEEQALKYYAENDEFVQNDEVTFADDNVQPFDYGTFGKVDEAVTPLRFGRFITSITTNVTTTIEPGDTSAIARVEKTIVGLFKIRAITLNGDTTTIEKPFTDLAVRNVIFKRFNRNPNMFWKNWVPVASSLVDGGTVNPATALDIQQVTMFLPNGDTIMVKNPTDYFLKYRWVMLWQMWHGWKRDVPELSSGQPVRIQVMVKSASADSDYVALRYGYGFNTKKRVKLNMVSESNNGDGTYTRVFETSRVAPLFVHFHRGFFNMGIDAVTHATLHDDAPGSYSASWWGIPYRVF
jgi:hypothetical protein